MAVIRKLNVNGDTHTVAVEPSETLLDVLRDKLHLTGTKKGCNVGDCGACTVLIDGEAINSCLLLAWEMEGKAITTIEGLAKSGEPTPLQKAFVHEGGLQCGFCTPGTILSATALLNENPSPSTDDQGGPGWEPLPLHRIHRNSSRCTTSPGLRRFSSYRSRRGRRFTGNIRRTQSSRGLQPARNNRCWRRLAM